MTLKWIFLTSYLTRYHTLLSEYGKILAIFTDKTKAVVLWGSGSLVI